MDSLLNVSAQERESFPEVYWNIYHDTSAPAYSYPDAEPAASVQRMIRPLPQRQVPGDHEGRENAYVTQCPRHS